MNPEQIRDRIRRGETVTLEQAIEAMRYTPSMKTPKLVHCCDCHQTFTMLDAPAQFLCSACQDARNFGVDPSEPWEQPSFKEKLFLTACIALGCAGFAALVAMGLMWWNQKL